MLEVHLKVHILGDLYTSSAGPFNKGKVQLTQDKTKVAISFHVLIIFMNLWFRTFFPVYFLTHFSIFQI